MLHNRKTWRFILAFVALAAFGAACGHEYVHVTHTMHCAACQVGHADASDVPAALTLAVVFVVIFLLKSAASTRPISINIFDTPGRSPPATTL